MPAAGDPAPKPCTTGTQIGVYRIESPLGEGGMGTVYRALDTRLKRFVAVKLLSNELADEMARRRFQREAQMASSLNHPHILTVHDAGEFEGRQYLVTEYVDGGTLKDWARAGKRNWRDVIELLTGVADGLAAAHDAGITHRDIKPANILVSKSGYAKLADFGLAKLMEDATPREETRTLTENTRPGMIVGTIAYMSPEQASGRRVDARSDIFSFGVVLYELLAGRRPFAGATDLQTLQAILHGAAVRLGEEVPAPVRAVVEKALAKDPQDRYQSMRQMVVDLRQLARQSGEVSGAAPGRGQWKWIAAVLALAVVSAGLLWRQSQTPVKPLQREYTKLTNFTDSATWPALSPDGRMLTFIRSSESNASAGEVYVKLLPDGQPVQLTYDGTIKLSPVFIPGSDRIAYGVAGGMTSKLGWGTWTVPILGGGDPSLMLANTSVMSWIPGVSPPRILFSEIGEGVHMSVVTSAVNRSESRFVYTPSSLSGMAHRSYLSPDRRQMLVVEMDGGWQPCRLVPFEGGGPGKLVGPVPAQCTTAAWSPDSKWMYFSVNTGNGYHIWRQMFPGGVPEQVTFGATEEEGIAFLADGQSFLTSIGTRQATLWVHDARGDRQITSEGYASLPRFSADGKRLYYLLRSRSNRRFVSGELWAVDLETEKHERLLPDFLIEDYSISGDDTQIVFVAIDDSGNRPVWLAAVDGRTPPRRLSSMNAQRAFFGRTGEVVIAAERFLYRVGEDGTDFRKLTETPIEYTYGVSPDGSATADWSMGPVTIHHFDGRPPVEVSTVCGAAGGENRGVTPPCVSWSPDGKFIYFNLRTLRQVCAVPLPSGRMLPALPKGGIHSLEDAASLPGARIISEERTFFGPNPSIYVFARLSTHRNIYRVPVP